MPPIRITRRFDAPPSEVFRAWTDPRMLERWAWGSIAGEVRAECDARPGGRYRIGNRREGGEEVAFHGSYRELVPHTKIVCTLEWDAPMGYDVAAESLAITLTGMAEGTGMLFEHDGVADEPARKRHEEGWNDTFDALERLLSRGKA